MGALENLCERWGITLAVLSDENGAIETALQGISYRDGLTISVTEPRDVPMALTALKKLFPGDRNLISSQATSIDDGRQNTRVRANWDTARAVLTVQYETPWTIDEGSQFLEDLWNAGAGNRMKLYYPMEKDGYVEGWKQYYIEDDGEEWYYYPYDAVLKCLLSPIGFFDGGITYRSGSKKRGNMALPKWSSKQIATLADEEYMHMANRGFNDLAELMFRLWAPGYCLEGEWDADDAEDSFYGFMEDMGIDMWTVDLLKQWILEEGIGIKAEIDDLGYVWLCMTVG